MGRPLLLLSTIVAAILTAGIVTYSIDDAGGRPAQQRRAPRPNPPRNVASGPPAPPRRPSLPPAPRTVAAVVDSFSVVARSRYKPACDRHRIPWPPKRLMLLAFKQERILEIWGAGETGSYARLATHRILAASGGSGPKRRQGDRQVPEGFYTLPLLNPNSDYHLSIKVDYPNGSDIANSAIPVDEMGGDIYIHGKKVSIGCLALGDRTIEELFTLAAQVPAVDRRIIIAPFDFRARPNRRFPKESAWVHEVYRSIKRELSAFPLSGAPRRVR